MCLKITLINLTILRQFRRKINLLSWHLMREDIIYAVGVNFLTKYSLKMKAIYLIMVLTFLVPALYPKNHPDSSKYTVVEKFDPARDPEKDLKEAVKEAQRSDRRILLDVGGDWCIWCHYLDKFFEENEDVSEFMRKNFVVVKINYSKENENKKFFSKFPEVDGYPHFFVLEKNGKLLHSQSTAELEKGRGHDREKVLNFLKKWAGS